MVQFYKLYFVFSALYDMATLYIFVFPIQFGLSVRVLTLKVVSLG